MVDSSGVELVADAGAAAATGEFFRSPPFLRAERVTHTLLVETIDGRLALPLRVREIPGGRGRDALSPYGYPGGTLTGPPLEPGMLDLRPTGLVSVFVRDRVDAPVLRGGTERGTLLLHRPTEPRTLGKDVRKQVRRNERNGYTVERVPAADVDDELVKAFAVAYEHTMQRADAADRYLFSTDYLRSCLEFERSWLVVTRAPAGDLAAARIVVASDGALHTYLSATNPEHRNAAPTKNGFVAALDLADELDMVLNHGGGLAPGDGLERFKRGFANAETSFRTHELIADPTAYAELSEGAPANTTFFPAYRAPHA